MHETILKYIKVGGTVLISGALAGVILYKIAISNIGFNASNLGTTDVLSIFLALFSVALSVMFYFKSSEESSKFYNYSYTFTKDISLILGRIEAGFGERLKHLDESYSTVRERLDVAVMERRKTAENVKEEEKDVKNAVAERDNLIAQLMERANLGAEEKNVIQHKLAEKEQELDYAKKQLFEYRRKLRGLERMPEPPPREIPDDLNAAVADLASHIERRHILLAPDSWLSRHIKERSNKLSPVTLDILKAHHVLTNELDVTEEGRHLLKQLTRDRS